MIFLQKKLKRFFQIWQDDAASVGRVQIPVEAGRNARRTQASAH